MLCSTVALTVMIHAVLYRAVDSLDVLAIRSAGLLGKIVHISYLTFLFSGRLIDPSRILLTLISNFM